MIKDLWPDYQLARENLFTLYRNVLLQLNQTYKEMGKIEFNLISKISKIQYKPEFDIKYIKKIGTIISQIDFKLIHDKKLPAYSFENSSHYIDDLIIILEKFFENLINLAEKEDLMLNYAINFKKISRRINSLTNIIIPEYERDIKKIKAILEENERESFVRLKKTKDLIKRKQKIH